MLFQVYKSTSSGLSHFPPSVGGLDLNSSSSGCARLGSGVAPPLGVVKEEVAVLIVLVRGAVVLLSYCLSSPVLVRWHRRAVCAAVRRAVDDEVPDNYDCFRPKVLFSKLVVLNFALFVTALLSLVGAI